MKKKIIMCLMLVTCIVGITACESGTSPEAEEKKDTTSAVEVDNVTTEVDSVTNEMSASEKEEYDLISKYFDITKFERYNGRIVENQIDKGFSSMLVDNVSFVLGKSYNDILSLGYTPEDESFADKNPKSVAVVSEFINDKGSYVRLGFAAKDRRDENITVSDGSFLYSIKAYPERNSFLIHGISENSTITDIINVLGEPCRIDAGYYSDFPDMEMVYESKRLSQYLTFYVNLRTEKIVVVCIEGYTE